MEGIGRRLKEAREKKNLTQGEVAEKLGLNTSTISKYESEDRGLSLGLITKLAKVYGVSSDYFLLGKKEPEIRTSYRATDITDEDDLLVIEWADTFIRDLHEVMKLSK